MQVFPLNSIERAYNISGLLFGLLVFSTLISTRPASLMSFRLSRQEQVNTLVTLKRFAQQMA